MELITAATVQRTLASIPGPRCRAVSYVFASEDAEALFMATASDESVISYAAAIAIATVKVPAIRSAPMSSAVSTGR